MAPYTTVETLKPFFQANKLFRKSFCPRLSDQNPLLKDISGSPCLFLKWAPSSRPPINPLARSSTRRRFWKLWATKWSSYTLTSGISCEWRGKQETFYWIRFCWKQMNQKFVITMNKLKTHFLVLFQSLSESLILFPCLKLVSLWWCLWEYIWRSIFNDK